MEFILNEKGQAIIRKCENCIHWRKISENKDDQNGYCKAQRLMFAYTHKNNLYAITKSFYFCEERHRLYNEDELREQFGSIYFKDVEVAAESNRETK